ncbi:hypothetical protein VaNZ11_012668 [Volvox africanus]|uniref:Uncharacterized protein n=1 Tax=Volvox africanus TaxID=51714 RepID=A0ABQ5SEE3_9CHLO|nr:hypothetical protein VaNZ11_012668 [Volvox africanus]
MGRLSFKRKSKTSSPTAPSPGELSGSPSSVPEQGNGDAHLVASSNSSPTSGVLKDATVYKSYSTPAKANRSSVGHGSGNDNADSRMFAEQLHRLRTRLQSVVQGVRDVAQSLDEPHSLISNVRDQLQTRQEAAVARRNAASTLATGVPERENAAIATTGPVTDGVSGGATGAIHTGVSAATQTAAPLSRTSSHGSRNGSSLHHSKNEAVGAMEETSFAPAASVSSGPHGVAALMALEGTSMLADDGVSCSANLSVKARVAEVERRSRSSGGMSEPLPGLAGPMPPHGVSAEGSLHRSSTAQASLLVARSFGNGRRGSGAAGAEEAIYADSPIRGFSPGLVPGSPKKATSLGSGPNSGTWRPVIVPPVAQTPSMAAIVAPSESKSHSLMGTDPVSRNASGDGALDATAALAAADIIAADAAELLGSGDDSLLAATANPAAAAAYLREHPETLRELWTLRARVRAQESEMTSVVIQLSNKNAQLDQAQMSLQAKERELAAITQRLTAVLAKLQSFQAAHGQEAQQPDQVRRASAGGVSASTGGVVGGVHGSSHAPAAPAAMTPPVAASLPDRRDNAVSAPDAAEAGAAKAGSSASLPASSTPQTPLRNAPLASSSASVMINNSHFAAAKAALQAEAEAAVVAAAGPSRAPRNTPSADASSAASTTASAAASTTPSAVASATSSPEHQQGGPRGTLEVSLPPPPSVRAPLDSNSQILAEAAVAEEADARALEGGGSGHVVDAATATASCARLPLSVRSPPSPSVAVSGAGSCVRAVTLPSGSNVLPSATSEPATVPPGAETASDVHIAEVTTVLRELSDVRGRVQAQEIDLALMMEELSTRTAQLDQAHNTLQDKERQLQEAAQRLESVIAQSRPQTQRRRNGGLLRFLLLQLSPSLACIGLLLRDKAVLQRLQQLGRLRVGPPRPARESLFPSPPPSKMSQPELGHRLLLPSPQRHVPPPQAPQLKSEQRPASRVMRVVAAVAAAARVRPAGAHRRRDTAPPLTSSATPEPLMLAGVDDRTRWSTECKSQWCKIIRPPRQEAVYY